MARPQDHALMLSMLLLGAQLPVLPALGSLRLTVPAQLGAETPFLQHLLQPLRGVLQQGNGEDGRNNVFSLKKGAEGGCDNNMIDMGEGPASSLPGACWCVTSVQL